MGANGVPRCECRERSPKVGRERSSKVGEIEILRVYDVSAIYKMTLRWLRTEYQTMGVAICTAEVLGSTEVSVSWGKKLA